MFHFEVVKEGIMKLDEKTSYVHALQRKAVLNVDFSEGSAM